MLSDFWILSNLQFCPNLANFQLLTISILSDLQFRCCPIFQFCPSFQFFNSSDFFLLFQFFLMSKKWKVHARLLGTFSLTPAAVVYWSCLFYALQEIGCDLAPLQYLKRWKSLSQMTTLPSADYSGGGTKTVSMFSKLMQQSSSFVMEGVKNLVVKKHNLPVTKIVDELMEVN